jgi:hypothetical protein
MPAKLAVVPILLALIPTDTHAQQRTIYDAKTGKASGRSTTDTQGTTTLYGADGKAISRESGTTNYDARSGNAVGKITKEKR